MIVHQIDPIKDPRWNELVERHCRASVFHTVGWLQALRETYGYEPVVFTTSPPTVALKNAMVLCRINSWLTGNRIVSLPFADHCEPLCDSTEDLEFLIRYLQTDFERQGWRYLEVRPINGNFIRTNATIGLLPTAAYFLHVLDLGPDLDKLFRDLDKDSIQRRIQRAERANLVEKCGRSEDLLKEFYDLFVVTRKRHGLPPPPYTWFRNLVQYQGSALEIRLAYKDNAPISGILTLKFKETVYYKYGCSHPLFNRFGATPWLLWQAIVAAKSKGATTFDLGRTEEDNAGLVFFKNHWVPQSKRLVYWRFPERTSLDSLSGWKLNITKSVFSRMPNKLLKITGKLIYRHFG